MTPLDNLRENYEKQIVEALALGFERELFIAALDNLDNPGPLRFNNFSYALRELVLLILERLAPNKNVSACAWFQPHPTVTYGITRAHRATYAIQGGLSASFVAKVLNIDVQPTVNQLMEAINVLNKYTHVSLCTFNLSETEVLGLAEECLQAASFFAEHIAECRRAVIHALEEDVDAHLLETVISETIQEIDELASHHWIDGVDVVNAVVNEIAPNFIRIEVKGEISVGLQYGSNSDLQNDIGAVTSDVFPFTANMKVNMVRPLGKSAFVETFSVDTKNWYE